MAHNPGAAGNHTALSDHGAAGHAHATGHSRVVSDPDVMGNLNQIVELDPVTYDGITQGPTINGRIRSHVNVISDHHPSQLRYLEPAAILFPDIAEPFAANDRSRGDNAAFSDQAIVHDNSAGLDSRTLPNEAARPYYGARAYDHIGLQDRAAFDHRVRPDADIARELSRGIDRGARMAPRGQLLGGVQEIGDARECHPRLGTHEGVTGEQIRVFGLQNEGPGRACGYQAAVSGRGAIGDVPRARLIEGGHGIYLVFGVSAQGRLGDSRQLTQCVRHVRSGRARLLDSKPSHWRLFPLVHEKRTKRKLHGARLVTGMRIQGPCNTNT